MFPTDPAGRPVENATDVRPTSPLPDVSHSHALSRRAAIVLLAAATLLTACTDDTRNPVAPVAPPTPTSRAGTSLTCAVHVKAGSLSCVTNTATPPAGSMAIQVIGGQDSYVRLTSASTAWDAGTEILSSSVTVQNLVQSALGTPDGSTVTGVMVFMQSGPTVTSGSGSVSLLADGTATFLATGQPYIMYNQKLEPYELSQPRTWMFSVPATVSTFTFQVYVAADVVDPSAPMLDAVWSGASTTDSLWTDTLNWYGGRFPSDTAIVAIPSDSLLASHVQPKLGANVLLRGLRVGYGSSLNLAGFSLTATQHVDAIGAISNGTLNVTGTSALIGGNLPAVAVSGNAGLQRTTTLSGALSVSGSLTANGQTLTISIP